jgi:hypothetical protein
MPKTRRLPIGVQKGLWRILGADNWPKLYGAEQACAKEIGDVPLFVEIGRAGGTREVR